MTPWLRGKLASAAYRLLLRLPPELKHELLLRLPPELKHELLLRLPTELKHELLAQLLDTLPPHEIPEKRVRRFLQRVKNDCEPAMVVGLRRELEVVLPLDYDKSNIVLRAASAMEIARTRAAWKEPWTVRWIEASLRDGDVLYDVGANVGAYSLIAARQPASITVLAFEPSFENYAALCDNIALNGCEATVTAIAIALGRETCLEVFNYRERGAGQALHTLGLSIDQFGKPYEPQLRQRLLSITLDDAVRHLRLPPPTHIKIDVDGTEFDVLDGGIAVLREPTLRSVLMELNEARAPEEAVRQRMISTGLTLVDRHERSSTDKTVYLVFQRDR